MSQCAKCGKEITSKITGELCTSCYFSKGKSNVSNDNPNPVDSNISTNESAEVIKGNDTDIRSDSETDGKGITESEIKHQPSKDRQLPDPTKKYCQSCIERGFPLVLASHEWTPGYFICDDCYEPLMNNIVQVERVEVERIKTDIKCDSPILNQIYELLNIPETLRFNSTDDVINGRNDIFIHHSNAVINMSPEQVKERIEFLQTILFNIRYSIDPYQNYINIEKAKAREASGLAGLEKSKKEAGKAGPKAKLSDEEKFLKSLGMINDRMSQSEKDEAVKKYREMQRIAKEKTFEKIVSK